MIEVSIGGLPVEEQDIDIDGLSVISELNEFYFGYTQGSGIGIASSKTDAKITITNSTVIEKIRNEIRINGIDAKIPVVIDGNEFYVYMQSYEEDGCCESKFTLKPKLEFELLSREDINYPIALNDTIKVPIRSLAKTTDWKTEGSYFGSSPTFDHSIPLKTLSNNLGTGFDVVVGDNKPFFVSRYNGCMKVNPKIKFQADATEDASFTIFLLRNEDVVYQSTYSISSTLTTYTFSPSIQLSIVGGDALKLKIIGANQGVSFGFYYEDDNSGISVVTCESTSIDWRDVKAVSIKDTLKGIITRASNGKLSLCDYIFDCDVFEGYLTNNKGLVNKDGIIKMSLKNLFEEINNKYPASLSIDGGCVHLVSRGDLFKGRCTPVDAEELKRSASAFTFNLAKTGYNKYSDSPELSNLEYNAKREYANNLTDKKEVSLLNDVSASATLINERILEEKDAETEIYWVHVNKNTKRAETKEFIVSDVDQADRAINLRISPRRNLYRWSKYLTGEFEFISGEGNFNFEVKDSHSSCIDDPVDYKETDRVKSKSIFGFFDYDITVESCDLKIGNKICFDYCGERIEAIVRSMTNDYIQGVKLYTIKATEINAVI